jgi:hypothetical protein
VNRNGSTIQCPQEKQKHRTMVYKTLHRNKTMVYKTLYRNKTIVYNTLHRKQNNGIQNTT